MSCETFRIGAMRRAGTKSAPEPYSQYGEDDDEVKPKRCA